MASRDELKRLIDELPEAVIGELVDFAQFLRQKEARRAFNSVQGAMEALPEDDELESAGEAEAVSAAKASTAPRISAAEARRRLLD